MFSRKRGETAGFSVGVDQQPTIPWPTYEDTVGGRPLGDPPVWSAG
jgi:hypothetical protein